MNEWPMIIDLYTCIYNRLLSIYYCSVVLGFVFLACILLSPLIHTLKSVYIVCV